MPRPLSASSSGPVDLADLIVHAVPGARPETHALLTQSARIRSAAANDIIFSQGEPVQLTLVTRGYGAFRRTTADGRQLALGVVTRGDLIGFSSIASRRATVDLVALTDSEFALWSGRQLRQLAASDSGLALDVMDGMARLMQDITERVDGFIRQNARQRVLRVLATYGDLFFGPSAVLSRKHLPSLVGTSREMTGRVIRDLERDRVIARVGRTELRLVSPRRLSEAATALAIEES